MWHTIGMSPDVLGSQMGWKRRKNGYALMGKVWMGREKIARNGERLLRSSRESIGTLAKFPILVGTANELGTAQDVPDCFYLR